MRFYLIIALALFGLPTVASAAEIVTYTYDTKGRLTDVRHTGGPQDAATAAYRYDAADNRTRLTVSNAKPVTTVNAAPVIVVPLNGLTTIVVAPDI